MPQVSIIVLTYNSDNEKLRKTLEAAIAQKGISLEIIISDDGSVRKDFSFLPYFFESHNFSCYRLVENPVNRGTVYNSFSGIQAACGEFVFLTSPGDILFDDSTIATFYQFAKSHTASICFGNAVFYTVESHIAKQAANFTSPVNPSKYSHDMALSSQKTAFFGGDWIIGASYFRSRSFALSAFQKLLDVSIYTEDTTSTMLALCEGIKLHYLDRNIVWYEYGTGVSTGISEKWKKLLNKDLLAATELICKEYPKDPWADLMRLNISIESKSRRLAHKLLCHPILTVQSIIVKLGQKKTISCTPADWERLNFFLFQKHTT